MYISSSTALSPLHFPSFPFPFYEESPLVAVVSLFGFGIIRQRKNLLLRNLLVLSMDRRVHGIYAQTDFAISSIPYPCPSPCPLTPPHPALYPHSIPATSSYSPDPTTWSLYQTPAHAGNTIYRDVQARAQARVRTAAAAAVHRDEMRGVGANAWVRESKLVLLSLELGEGLQEGPGW